MKIIFADFQIAKYGGIISYMNAMIKAFIDLGHEVDIVQFTASSITPKQYCKKITEFESERELKINSQAGGYEQSILGYWENHYYGFFLPPSNRINAFDDDALFKWIEHAETADIILWNFMPTESKTWVKKDKPFNFWHKFFDLPTNEIKQIFLVHDAYFDVRASNVTALKDKIYFLGCAHIAAYHCCENIGIPRTLLLNPRYTPENIQWPYKPVEYRKIDFFAAHIFKSMKHMEDLIRAVPHLNLSAMDIEYQVEIAGSGIEQAYMVAKDKVKPNYRVNKKYDSDIEDKFIGERIWDVAELRGMDYQGQLSGDEVKQTLLNTRFAIDPSWAKHYANYCRTHINGFIIEAVLCGAYPVLRDYRGLVKEEVEDPIFDALNAIYIPWDATPKQFADILKEAYKMSDAKFLKDTKANFELVVELFNAHNNAKEIIRLVEGGKEFVEQEMQIGQDSQNVTEICSRIMEGFFGITLPIDWETE